MASLAIGALVGAALGTIVLGAASAASHGTVGLDVALQHIPAWAHGYTVVSAVRDALAGAAAGGGIGAAVAAAAKSGAAAP